MALNPSYIKFLTSLSDGQRRIFINEVFTVLRKYKLDFEIVDESVLKYIKDDIPLVLKGIDMFVRMAMSVFCNRSKKQITNMKFRCMHDGRFYLFITHGLDVLVLTFYTEVVA